MSASYWCILLFFWCDVKIRIIKRRCSRGNESFYLAGDERVSGADGGILASVAERECMMARKKRLPIGIDGFEKVRSNDFYYVDKSMFIAELLRNWGEVNLFTRPRRFGKSLNMSMLKAFFEIGTDNRLFDGLKITAEKELCANYMGKYPVISVSLKDVGGFNYQEACAALRDIIGKEANRFFFLENSDRLLPGEKELYRALVNVENGMFTIPDAALSASLQTLSMLLAKHYGRKVMILIDEYDVPLDKAFQSGYYPEMVALIRNLFSKALKGNDSLQFAVLTGCLRIGKESIFTGLNNPKVHTITDTRYDEYFGFTDRDVMEILEYYGMTDHGDAIKEWYDGYQFGNVSVYCPWDVMNYCDELLDNSQALPKNYWANTSGNAMVRRFIDKGNQQTRSEIESLIAGESITKTINVELTYSELDDTIENLWSVLFTTGYLTQRGMPSEEQYELVIPNREIRALFISQIQAWFQETTRADAPRLRKLCNAVVEAEVSIVEEMLNEYLWNSISIRDTAVRSDKKESFYHGMLLGLLQYDENWRIKSNEESGTGYSDILIQTQNRVGVVIEVKYAEKGNLEQECANALRQIEEKQYAARLRGDGMKEIIKYGIAFYKKHCKVVLG